MRASLAFSLIIILVAFDARSDERIVDDGKADEASSPETVVWQKPFEAISSSEASETLVLVLITNDDPFLTQAAIDQFEQEESDAGPKLKVPRNPPVWCSDVLAYSYRKMLDQRVDLRRRIKLQSIAAGLPRELTGGQGRNIPSRAVLALCDGNYRLLGLTIGVPAPNELLTLIEDGEDVATIQELNRDQPAMVVDQIAARSRDRLSRMWRAALQEVLSVMEGERSDADDNDRQEAFEGRMRLLSDSFEPIYLADVKLRFGLTEASDQTRLVVLEQHPEARRPWCESIIPLVAGQDFALTWKELVESLWGHQPITADAEAPELLEWYDSQAKTDAVVLSLQAPFHLRRLRWPPIRDPSSKRGVGWQEVHKLALQHPNRTVQPQQLAVLLRQRPLNAIDMQQPSLARYLLLEPKKKAPYVVRESDSPGRIAGMLKRTNSSLVKE